MKKILMNKNFVTIFGIITLLLCLFLFGGCTNKQVFDFEYKFDKAICRIGNETKEIKIKTWKDYDGEQLQIKDNEGNTYLVSSFNCTLVNEG